MFLDIAQCPLGDKVSPRWEPLFYKDEWRLDSAGG